MTHRQPELRKHGHRGFTMFQQNRIFRSLVSAEGLRKGFPCIEEHVCFTVCVFRHTAGLEIEKSQDPMLVDVALDHDLE